MRRLFLLTAGICLATAMSSRPAQAAAPSPLYAVQLQAGVAGLGKDVTEVDLLVGAADSQAGATVYAVPLSFVSGSGCVISICLGSVCVVSGCRASLCLGSGCIQSRCLGSYCYQSKCLGSRCYLSTCNSSNCFGTGCNYSYCAGSLCKNVPQCQPKSYMSQSYCWAQTQGGLASVVAPQVGGVDLAVTSAGTYAVGYLDADGKAGELRVSLDEQVVRFVKLPSGTTLTSVRPS